MSASRKSFAGMNQKRRSRHFPTDRDRFLTLIDKLLADPRVNESITPEQAKMAKRIRKLCETGVSALAV